MAKKKQSSPVKPARTPGLSGKKPAREHESAAVKAAPLKDAAEGVEGKVAPTPAELNASYQDRGPEAETNHQARKPAPSETTCSPHGGKACKNGRLPCWLKLILVLGCLGGGGWWLGEEFGAVKRAFFAFDTRLSALENHVKVASHEGPEQVLNAKMEHLVHSVQTDREEAQKEISTIRTELLHIHTQLTQALQKIEEEQKAITAARQENARLENMQPRMVQDTGYWMEIAHALREGKSFVLDQDKCRAEFSSEVCGTLQEVQEGGSASYESLQTEFNVLVPKILQHQEDDSQGPIRRMVNKLITIRKVGKKVDPSSVDGVLNQIEAHLKAREWSGILKALEKLPAVAQSDCSEWRKHIEQFVERDKAYKEVATRALPPGAGKVE